MKSAAIRVPLHKGEETRRKLKREGILREDLYPKREDNFLILPVTGEVEGFELFEDEFRPKEERINTYKDVVEIPDEELKKLLPTSYDMIGDIALIKIPQKLKKYREEIGKALLKAHKNIRAVYHAEPVSGELRTRKLEFLGGERKTRTFYREYGIEMEVDIAKVFFSPRLSRERYRIAKLVRDGEIVIDMFAGCAPFSLMIAKYANPKIVYAIDINREAVKLAVENVKRNKLLHKIEIMEGDSSKIVQELAEKGVRADRIIMNLPFGAREFLPDALTVSKKGTYIHYYAIVRESDIENHIEYLKKVSNNCIDVVDINKIKTYAPREFYTCFDIIVNRKPA